MAGKREPAKSGRVGKHLYRMPFMSKEHPNYVRHLREIGIKQVVALEQPSPKLVNELTNAGISVHNFHIEPYHSFTGKYPKVMLQAAKKLEESEGEGIPTALSCTFGQRRSARVIYLTNRMLGKTHIEALSAARPRPEDGERLRELYEKS
jgi:hypothetical protein